MDIDTNTPWIPFHKEVFDKISPLLQEHRFELVKKNISRPETLTYEREANSIRDFARIIIHGGGYFPTNIIYIQATSGDFHLTDSTKLIENFKPASLFGGWSYSNEKDLVVLIGELKVFIRETLLKWIENPFIVEQSANPSELPPTYLADLKKSLEIERELAERFRNEGNIKEAQKWEKSVRDKQEAILFLESRST